jgi:hypothetical protein
VMFSEHPDPRGEAEFLRMLAVLAGIAAGVWAIVRTLS